MSSQSAGERLRPRAKNSTNKRDINGHCAGANEQNGTSVSRHEECDHSKLRLLIEPLRNVFQAYCTSCFHQGPKAWTQRAAVRGFWAGMVGAHFTSNGYAHAASLSGYLGPDTPRLRPAEPGSRLQPSRRPGMSILLCFQSARSGTVMQLPPLPPKAPIIHK